MTAKRFMERQVSKLAAVLILGGAVSLPLGIAYLQNSITTNRTISKPAYVMFSEARGLGHIEFTKYKDGSSDVKAYPTLRWNISSDLMQDLNGDGKVDRIRMQGTWFKKERLNDILVREYDYSKHQSEFDNADSTLQELMQRYCGGK